MHGKSNCHQRGPVKAAFTLVELLVSMSIISLMLALLLPAVGAAREAARRTQCSVNLQQIGLALHMYHGSHRQFPAGISTSYDFSTRTGDVSMDAMFWSGAILPFLEQGALFEKLTPHGSWSSGFNAQALRKTLSIFRCPSSAAPNFFTHGIQRRVPATYLGCSSGTETRETAPECRMFWNVQNGAFFVNSKTKFAHMFDGSSSTIIVGESLPDYVQVQADGSGVRQLVDHWAIGTPTFAFNEVSEALGTTAVPMGNSLRRDPSIYPDDQELSFSSQHRGGAQFVFSDGHVTMLSNSIDQEVYSALGTKDEQEWVDHDSF